MKLRITGRHMDMTPALRDYIESRFERLDRYGLKVGSLQVVLSVEKLQHKAEVVGAVNGKRVQAKTATREMYATIDALIDRVDAQFRKWKERLANHKPGKMKKSRQPARTPAKWGQDDDASPVERQAVPVLSLAQAQKQFRAEAAQPFMVFVNAENGRLQVVQRTGGGRLAIVEPYAEDGRGVPSVR
ncbi:ribosome hibernation-promoting factor, HPF/YfiA family [Nitrospira moscoviensis]|uniref:Ribosome hibernation promoting factor n=1 Tax=Nitrospira moscoviensis TaxID=42253 RepID=A0A0K2GAN6_NITMO|nr:ribosome-associated translation inhibitor RaiA [Nitrospira moscoviensis]ALA57667.1 putative Ribosomal protein S30Ae-family protein, sigma-54 modulation protein [Nitrospira moscoviensis]